MSRADILLRAVKLALRNNVDRKRISVPHWALTYGVSQKLVRETWADELTKQTNNQPMGTDE